MTSSGVPVLDLAQGLAGASERTQLDEACRRWGFFQVVGHGVDAALLAATLDEMRRFFARPPEHKQALLRSASNPWGYYDRELTKNTRDWKEIFDVGPRETEGPLAGAEPQWPSHAPEFRATLLAFSRACEKVAFRLLDVIGANLGARDGELAGFFQPAHTSFLRLNHYPLCADPAPPDAPSVPASGHLGINRHTDAGALTVLLQDARAGLQVRRDGRWTTVEPLAGALTVNLGDIVQVWSNDRYPAPLHRVIASRSAPRYSAAYFFNPSYATDYAPLPGIPGPASRARYRPINWGDFRAGRASGDYADSGEEIQISHFRV